MGLLRAQQRRSRGGGDTASLLRCVPGSVLTPCLLSTWLSGSLLRSLSPQGGVAPRASVGILLPLAGVEASEIARQEGDARHRGHLLRICLPRLSVLSACPNPGLLWLPYLQSVAHTVAEGFCEMEIKPRALSAPGPLKYPRLIQNKRPPKPRREEQVRSAPPSADAQRQEMTPQRMSPPPRRAPA